MSWIFQVCSIGVRPILEMPSTGKLCLLLDSRRKIVGCETMLIICRCLCQRLSQVSTFLLLNDWSCFPGNDQLKDLAWVCLSGVRCWKFRKLLDICNAPPGLWSLQVFQDHVVSYRYAIGLDYHKSDTVRPLPYTGWSFVCKGKCSVWTWVRCSRSHVLWRELKSSNVQISRTRQGWESYWNLLGKRILIGNCNGILMYTSLYRDKHTKRKYEGATMPVKVKDFQTHALHMSYDIKRTVM